MAKRIPSPITSGQTGANYRATVRLTGRGGVVVAEVGETCERVAPQSLGWLIEQGLIAPIGSEPDGKGA